MKRYAYPDVRNSNSEITAKTVEDMNSLPGVPGVLCRCFDPDFPSQGVLFYWDSSINKWRAKPGEFLINAIPPVGSLYAASFTAPSGSTAYILHGQIPKDCIRHGDNLLVSSFVRGGPSPIPTYLAFRLDGYFSPGSAQFASGAISLQTFPAVVNTFLRCTRNDLTNNTPDRVTLAVSGVDRAAAAIDFSTDSPFYTMIQTPNTGVTYEVIRAFIKVAD